MAWPSPYCLSLNPDTVVMTVKVDLGLCLFNGGLVVLWVGVLWLALSITGNSDMDSTDTVWS